MPDLTHASFFTGAGGLDHGLELAGWQTVSTSEIDKYACALIAERFPGVPNLGDITMIDPEVIPDATLWTGGFPCQDLSKAGKRRGFGGDRSVLAFAFLDLVERRRPPWFILENVDGLLSSNGGRDLARLVGEVDGLGYGLAWRVLDAQWFGVAQRRRRVYLVASRDSDRAGAVLLEPEVGPGDPPASVAARTGAARTARRSSDGGRGPDIAGTLTRRYGKGVNTTVDDGAVIVVGAIGTRPYDDRGHEQGGLLVGAAPDAARVRAADGLAGRLDDRGVLVAETGIVSALTGRIGTSGPDVADAQAGHLIVPEVAGTLQAASPGGGYRVDADGAATHLIVVAGLGSDGPNTGSAELAPTLRVGPHSVAAGGPGDTVPIVAFEKRHRAVSPEDAETWAAAAIAPTLTDFDATEARAVALIAGSSADVNDALLPLGLDGHRYRMTGNGVAAPVAAWIGRRLAEEVQRV